MSWLKKAWQKISSSQQYNKADITEFGISVVQASLLPERLAEQEKPFMDGDPFANLDYSDPTKAFKRLVETTMRLDATVRKTAFPFGRAMDELAFARVIRGYEAVMNWTNWIFGVVGRLIAEKDGAEKDLVPSGDLMLSSIDKIELVKKLEWFVKAVPFKAQRIILSRTWSREDVTGSKTGVMQQLSYGPNYPTRQWDVGSPGPPFERKVIRRTADEGER